MRHRAPPSLKTPHRLLLVTNGVGGYDPGGTRGGFFRRIRERAVSCTEARRVTREWGAGYFGMCESPRMSSVRNITAGFDDVFGEGRGNCRQDDGALVESVFERLANELEDAEDASSFLRLAKELKATVRRARVVNGSRRFQVWELEHVEGVALLVAEWDRSGARPKISRARCFVSQ